MILRFCLLTIVLFSIASQTSAMASVCSPADIRAVIAGVLITVTPRPGPSKCSDQSSSSEYLDALVNLAASSWALPIGWSPFPSAIVKFEFSKGGGLINLTTIESSSSEISACSHQVLNFAAQRLAPRFPGCLSGLGFTANVEIPWNSIGIIRPALEDVPLEMKVLSIGDLKEFTPSLDIQELDSFEPNE
jgi:hypothetical protein